MYPFWKYALHRRFPRRHILDEDTAARMNALFARASVRDWYVAGIRVVRIRTFFQLSSVEIFGLPIFQVRRRAGKMCCCIGSLEILKRRVSGPLSSGTKDGPLMLREERPGVRRLFWNIGPLAFGDETSGEIGRAHV